MIIQNNISLKQFNTFRVDVSAKYFCEVNDLSELKSLISAEQFKSEQKLILGGGSNILFTKDFDGIIIKNNIGGIEVISENNDNVFLEVGAGYDWDKLVEYCVNNEFYGLENLSLIPGTVGASPIQNIGAYGVEVKDVIDSVNVIHLENLEQKTFKNSECKFGYRDSIFKKNLKNKVIVTSVIFNLSKIIKVKSNYEAIKNYLSENSISVITPIEIRNAIIEIRKSKLPDTSKIGSAGSFFKNPVISIKNFERIKANHPDMSGYRVNNSTVKISAGWLIEKCGLKGKRLGDVGIYGKQALVLVNYGNSTGKEILDFSRIVQEDVKSKFDLDLINEVNIL